MNPLSLKQTRLQRSISAKVNPEEEKSKIFKPHESLEFHRDFSFRSKMIEPSSIQNHLEAKMQENRQLFMKNQPSDSYQRPGILSAREQLKNKLNPCNPFESLTQSSVRRNPDNQKAMELILAHRKIAELEKNVQTLTKELNLAKQHKFQLDKLNSNHLSSMKTQINQLIKQKQRLESKNDQVSKSFEKLRLENENLRLQIQSQKFGQNNLSQKLNEKSHLNPQKQAEKFKELGHEFQRKINDLYEENYKLKNKVSWFQGKLEQSQTLVSSLKNLNQLLEKRFYKEENEGETLKETLQKENDKRREENLCLKQEKQTLKQEHELEILKLENQLQEFKIEVRSTIKNSETKHPEDNCNMKNGSSYRKILKLQDMVESLQYAVKDHTDEILRLKEKNKKLTKMYNLNTK